MGGDEENPLLKPRQSQISSSHIRRRSGGGPGILAHFPEGSLVEVRTDEVDLKGVYFSATVISSSTAVPSRKRGRKKLPSVYVEFHDLLAREGLSDRLREHIKVTHMRPVPPLQEVVKGFEPEDVVDAFYKDGWWQGVVSRVLKGGNRFVVSFQNPPDELEFGLADLRPHWDWVNGRWVRPQKPSIAGLMFDVGRKVEVSFDREDSQDAWFTTTILKDLGNGVFLVEHMDNKGQAIQARVDSSHVRPCPPLLKDKNFVLFENVDAFFDSGWWSGVVTKELENCRYTVFFKQMKHDKEFNQSDLRPHMDWMDGKWFTSSQVSSVLRRMPFIGANYSPFFLNSDDGVHEHNTPKNFSASSVIVSTTPVKNSVDGKDTYDGKTLSSLTSMKGHLTPNNQKMSCVTTKRRKYLSNSGNTHSQTPNKFKEGIAREAKQQGKLDKTLEEDAFCGSLGPYSVNNTEISLAHTTGDQSSFKSSCGEKSRNQRNVHAKQNDGGKIKSTSSSMKKSCMQMLSERVGLDAGGEKPNAAGKNTEEDAQDVHAKEGTELPMIRGLPFAETGSPDFGISGGEEPNASGNYIEEDAQNKHAKEGTEVPIIIGLPCAVTGSPDFGISGGISSHFSNSKKNVTIVNDQEQHHNSFSVEERKDSTQPEIGNFNRKRKRGRPKKFSLVSAPVSGNAQDREVGSGDLNRKDDGLQRSPQVEVVAMEATMPDQGRNAVTEEELANEQFNLKNKRVRTVKRTSSILYKKKGVKEYVGLGDNCSPKRGRKRVTSKNIAAQDQDSVGTSGGKMMELNGMVNTNRVVGGVPRMPPESNSEQSMISVEKQRCSVVIGEPVESRKQGSSLADKDSIVPNEPQSLPSAENTVGKVLDIDSEKQTVSVTHEPQRLPFVENTSLWRNIESTMEIFQRMPQKPHFQPLQQVKGSSYREGLAIGYMVAYASLVERTSRLQLNDPRSVVDDIMGTVAELERHGFDVKFVQDCVANFLEAKDKEEKLVDEVNNLNNQILKHHIEKTRFDEEIREIKERMRKLQENIAVAKSGKEKEDDQIASLQVRMKNTEEVIENLRRDFKVGSGIS